MIVEWFFSLVAGFTDWIASQSPDYEVPAVITQVDDAINNVLGRMFGFGGWIDLPWMGLCVTASLGTWVVCLGIKFLMRIASYFPFVGGAG